MGCTRDAFALIFPDTITLQFTKSEGEDNWSMRHVFFLRIHRCTPSVITAPMAVMMKVPIMFGLRNNEWVALEMHLL